MLNVFKFGGDCSTIENIDYTIDFINKKGPNNLYVFSAIRGYTEKLLNNDKIKIISYHNKLIEKFKIHMDELIYFNKFVNCDEDTNFLAIGELITVELISNIIQNIGFKGGIWELGLKINNDGTFNHSCLSVLKENIENLDASKINIIAGWGAYDDENKLLTLSRGGGDTTALIIAHSINLTKCNLVKITDDGLYNIDPNIQSNITGKSVQIINTKHLLNCNYKIVNQECLFLANLYNITIQIFNIKNTKKPKTIINPYYSNHNLIMYNSELNEIKQENYDQQCIVQCNMFCNSNFKINEELKKFVYNKSPELIKKGKSICVIDLKTVDKLTQIWEKKMHPIIPHYAIKALPDNKICNFFEYFDCASANEFEQVIKLGKNPENIIYANTAKRMDDILQAKKFGVKLVTADSIHECIKINELYPECGIVLRIATSDEGAQFTKFAHKYGVVTYKNSCAIIDYLMLNNNLKGFSFHVGCGQTNRNAWNEAMVKVDKLFQYILDNYPDNYDSVKIIDIGGGYSTDENSIPIDVIRNSLDNWIQKYNDKKWIAEPGRFFSADAMTLLCPIISKNLRNQDRQYYVIANSIHHTFSCIIFDLHLPKNMDENDWINLDDGKLLNCVDGTIVGETCDGIDVLYHGKVAEKLPIGTLLVFPGMGAYSNASANHFNGFLPPEIYYL